MKIEKKEELSSLHLQDLKKNLDKIIKAEEYLKIETEKLKKNKELIKHKIRKEITIIQLKKRIRKIKSTKN